MIPSYTRSCENLLKTNNVISFNSGTARYVSLSLHLAKSARFPWAFPGFTYLHTAAHRRVPFQLSKCVPGQLTSPLYPSLTAMFYNAMPQPSICLLFKAYAVPQLSRQRRLWIVLAVGNALVMWLQVCRHLKPNVRVLISCLSALLALLLAATYLVFNGASRQTQTSKLTN